MKQEEVDKLFEDVRELLRLEKLLSENKMIQEDATSLKSLAVKGYPRAEFDYGLFLAIETKNIEDARVWFDRCCEHACVSLHHIVNAYGCEKSFITGVKKFG